jgi:hypothetical protein
VSDDAPEPLQLHTSSGDVPIYTCVCGCLIGAGFTGHFAVCPIAIADRQADSVTPGDEDE